MMLSVVGVERSGSTRLSQILDSLSFRVYDEIFHPRTPWGLRRDDLLLKTLQNIEFPDVIKEEHVEWTHSRKVNQKFTGKAMHSFSSNPLRVDNIPVKLAKELASTYEQVSMTIFLRHLDARTLAKLLSISRCILVTSRTPIDSFISMQKAKIGGAFVAHGTDTTAAKIDLDPAKLLAYTDANGKSYYELGKELGLIKMHSSVFFLKYEDWSNLKNNAQEIFVSGFLAAVMRETPANAEDLRWEPGLDAANSNNAMLRQDKSASWYDKVFNGEQLSETLASPKFRHCLSKYLLHEQFRRGYQSSRQIVV